MTAPGPELAATTKANGMMKWWVNSMWGFWLVLLTFSLGLATAIYYVWLKGNI
jgi:hypothetical protein